jgi:hypothetical protein
MVKTLLRIGAVAAGFALLAPLPVAAQNPPGLGTLDHYKVYRLDGPQPELPLVQLRDQFGVAPYSLHGPFWFSPPAQKNEELIHDPRIHLTWYEINSPIVDPPRRVIAHNQFGSYELDVNRSRYLLVPTLKNEQLPHPFPSLPVDHYKCYDAFGPLVDKTVTLITQFGTEVVDVRRPELLCNPVEKVHDGVTSSITNPTDHLARIIHEV